MVFILVPSNIRILPSTQTSDENFSFENTPDDCNINLNLIDQYLIVDVFVQQEENARGRVEKLRNNGFSEAFYVYLPCYKSRIPDNKMLFAVIIGQPCKSLTAIQKMNDTCKKRAVENQFELKYKYKILKLEAKDYLTINRL